MATTSFAEEDDSENTSRRVDCRALGDRLGNESMLARRKSPSMSMLVIAAAFLFDCTPSYHEPMSAKRKFLIDTV